VNTISEVRQTANVIADTKQGRAKPTVVMGAHLHSVPESPGMNDNGSSVATILEIALRMSKPNLAPKNRVRFAFWGAEEFEFRELSAVRQDPFCGREANIGPYLSFEMLGSPDYVGILCDGDGSDTPPAGPAGSAEVEKVFEHYFTAKRLPMEPYPFDGRSDYVLFWPLISPAGAQRQV
jgi:Zn-dependent M28 family amino/carboxypeptidase